MLSHRETKWMQDLDSGEFYVHATHSEIFFLFVEKLHVDIVCTFSCSQAEACDDGSRGVLKKSKTSSQDSEQVT